MKETTLTIDDKERAVAESIQAPLINRFCLSVSLSVLRIVFFETATTPYARAACCMAVEDAESLYLTLGNALAQMRPSEKKH